MMRSLSLLSTLLLSLLLAWLPPAPSQAADGSAGISSLTEAINKAGRQRMLTQRIVKSYCQFLLEVDPEKALEQLDGAIKLYERQLAELKQFATDAETRAGLAEVEKQWAPFVKAASARPTQEGLEELRRYDEELLKTSHQVVLTLEKQAKTPVGRLVNVAGRQRMISQRVAKFYMMHALGRGTDETAKLLDTAAQEFRSALDELMRASENTPDIKKSLTGVKQQWGVFEAAFRLDKGDYAPLMIARYSEKILVTMNEVTGMYETLAAN